MKYKKVILILILSVIALLCLFFSRTIFQEGNPFPVAYGIIELFVEGKGYAKLDEHTYIVKANPEDTKKFTDYLAQSNIIYVEQMGAGVFFKGKNGIIYTAIKRMYTSAFEIWDFGNQTPGRVLP